MSAPPIDEARDDRPRDREDAREVRRRLLTLRCERDGGTDRIGVSGELDLASAALLEEEIVRCEAGDAERIVLDLRGVEFIDSTGLAVLVKATLRDNRDSQRLLMLRPSAPEVQRILRIAGIDDRLPFDD